MTYESGSDDNIFDRERAQSKWDEEAKKIGRFNLAVFGKTGVGKSTLINTVFGDNVAPTGTGQPVTQDSSLYIHQEGFLGLYDTKGFEVGDDNAKILADLRELVQRSRNSPDAADHIHAVYYCVAAPSGRFEDSEAEFVRAVHALDLPVFLVLTQVHMKSTPTGERARHEHLQLANHIASVPNLPIHSGRPYLTAALPDPQLGYLAFGVDFLLDATSEAMPEQVQAALAAAQVIDQRLKRKAAKIRITAATATAAGIGASPIPFSDAALLVPLQMGMMASISQTYGIPIDKSLMASLAATAAATQVGKTIVANAMKMFPGINTVAMAASAAVSAAFTGAMGGAWMKTCEGILDGRFGALDALDEESVQTAFMSFFKKLFTERLKSIKSNPSTAGADNA